MKQITRFGAIAACAFMLCASCLAQSTSNSVAAIYNFAGFSSVPSSVVRITIAPLTPPPGSNWVGATLSHAPLPDGLMLPTPQQFSVAQYTNMRSGTLTVSNLWTGIPYQVCVNDIEGQTLYTNYFDTNLSGLVGANTNQTVLSNALPVVAGVLVAAGSGVVAVTNGNVVTVSTTGTATNASLVNGVSGAVSISGPGLVTNSPGNYTVTGGGATNAVTNNQSGVTLAGAFTGTLSGVATSLAPVTRLVTNGDGTTWSFALPQAAAGLPFVTISAHGIADGFSTLTNSGADFGPDSPGGTDAAVWWNAALAAVGAYDPHALGTDSRYTNSFGGTVYAFPGVFHCQSPIVITNSDIGGVQRPLCITIIGSGRNTTRIQDDRAGGTNFFSTTDLTSGGAEGFNFYAQGLWFHRTYYATTNLLSIVALGRLNHWDISDCAFTSGGILTNPNNDAALQANIYGNAGNLSGIIGLNIQSHFDNGGVVRECVFGGLAWGIVGAWDHPNTYNNTFWMCGLRYIAKANYQFGTAYPATNILSVGGAILNLGEGGGRFEKDHCFYDNAYLVSAWDNVEGRKWYGSDIISDTMLEELSHFVLDGDTNSIVQRNILVGQDNGGLGGSELVDAAGNYIVVEQLTNSVSGVTGSYGATAAWSTNQLLQEFPGGFQTQMSNGVGSLTGPLLSLQSKPGNLVFSGTNAGVSGSNSLGSLSLVGPTLTLISTNGAFLSIQNNGTNVINATGTSVSIPGATGISANGIVAGQLSAIRMANNGSGHSGQALMATGIESGGVWGSQWANMTNLLGDNTTVSISGGVVSVIPTNYTCLSFTNAVSTNVFGPSGQTNTVSGQVTFSVDNEGNVFSANSITAAGDSSFGTGTFGNSADIGLSQEGVFTGEGVDITNLLSASFLGTDSTGKLIATNNAANLTGKLPQSSLPNDVPLLDGTNYFKGSNFFGGFTFMSNNLSIYQPANNTSDWLSIYSNGIKISSINSRGHFKADPGATNYVALGQYGITTNGFYFPATNQVAVVNNGAVTMLWSNGQTYSTGAASFGNGAAVFNNDGSFIISNSYNNGFSLQGDNQGNISTHTGIMTLSGNAGVSGLSGSFGLNVTGGGTALDTGKITTDNNGALYAKTMTASNGFTGLGSGLTNAAGHSYVDSTVTNGLAAWNSLTNGATQGYIPFYGAGAWGWLNTNWENGYVGNATNLLWSSLGSQALVNSSAVYTWIQNSNTVTSNGVPALVGMTNGNGVAITNMQVTNLAAPVNAATGQSLVYTNNMWTNLTLATGGGASPSFNTSQFSSSGGFTNIVQGGITNNGVNVTNIQLGNITGAQWINTATGQVTFSMISPAVLYLTNNNYNLILSANGSTTTITPVGTPSQPEKIVIDQIGTNFISSY